MNGAKGRPEVTTASTLRVNFILSRGRCGRCQRWYFWPECLSGLHCLILAAGGGRRRGGQPKRARAPSKRKLEPWGLRREGASGGRDPASVRRSSTPPPEGREPFRAREEHHGRSRWKKWSPSLLKEGKKHTSSLTIYLLRENDSHTTARRGVSGTEGKKGAGGKRPVDDHVGAK